MNFFEVLKKIINKIEISFYVEFFWEYCASLNCNYFSINFFKKIKINVFWFVKIVSILMYIHIQFIYLSK